MRGPASYSVHISREDIGRRTLILIKLLLGQANKLENSSKMWNLRHQGHHRVNPRETLKDVLETLLAFMDPAWM